MKHQDSHFPQGRDACLDLWEKRCRTLVFTACKLGITELPPQGNRFCLLLYPASKKQGSATDIHTQTHRGVRAEATTQGKQEQLGPESCMGKGDGVTLGARGATLEVREWKEVLHKVRHGTYITEEHSNSARGAQVTQWPGDRPHGLDKTWYDNLLQGGPYPMPSPAV